MCGLYGFSSYADKIKADTGVLINALANESAIRGTDACGVAYNINNKIVIDKFPHAAYAVKFKPPQNICAIIGHTRHTTQGAAKKNYNNHPFYGKAGEIKFALTHNGVLYGTDIVRQEQHLPKTKIETDSYLAVQLLEQRKIINYDSLNFMVEHIGGSFSFALLDNRSNIWIVKGDSPISVLHFPQEKLYVYASTDSILWKAVIGTDLFNSLKNGNYEEIPLISGQILKIDSTGKLSYGVFHYDEQTIYGFGGKWYDYELNYTGYNEDSANDYIVMLKQAALMEGYDEKEIDTLFAEGFSYDEIEDYIYGCTQYSQKGYL